MSLSSEIIKKKYSLKMVLVNYEYLKNILLHFLSYILSKVKTVLIFIRPVFHFIKILYP